MIYRIYRRMTNGLELGFYIQAAEHLPESELQKLQCIIPLFPLQGELFQVYFWSPSGGLRDS